MPTYDVIGRTVTEKQKIAGFITDSDPGKADRCVRATFDQLLTPGLRRAAVARAWRRVGPNDAEDCVQMASVLAARELKGLRNPYVFQAWFSRILDRVCIDHQRSEARRLRCLSLDDAGFHDWLVSGVPGDIACDVENAEFACVINHFQCVLRTEVLSRWSVGKSHCEIASEMQKPIGTIKSRLHRERIKLRTRLAEYGWLD